MYTRCPQCKTVHTLDAALLAHARGSVRCGRCNTTFDALSCLFDEWPAGRAWGPAADTEVEAPLLGQPRGGSGQDGGVAAADEVGHDSADGPRAKLWAGALAALAVLTAVNVVWTFREPLLGVPVVRSWLQHEGWLEARKKGLLRAPDQIRLISRDMHTHPTRAGILVLSLTFVNLAPDRQAFPRVQITLLDSANQPVARRRLEPSEYLRPGADIASGLASGTLLPVLIELADPGERASGFEVRML